MSKINGAGLDGSTLLQRDDKSVVSNNTKPSSLFKKYYAISCHWIWKVVAVRIIWFSSLTSASYYAKIYTISLSSVTFYSLVKTLLFKSPCKSYSPLMVLCLSIKYFILVDPSSKQSYIIVVNSKKENLNNKFGIWNSVTITVQIYLGKQWNMEPIYSWSFKNNICIQQTTWRK